MSNTLQRLHVFLCETIFVSCPSTLDTSRTILRRMGPDRIIEKKIPLQKARVLTAARFSPGKKKKEIAGPTNEGLEPSTRFRILSINFRIFSISPIFHSILPGGHICSASFVGGVCEATHTAGVEKLNRYIYIYIYINIYIYIFHRFHVW